MVLMIFMRCISPGTWSNGLSSMSSSVRSQHWGIHKNGPFWDNFGTIDAAWAEGIIHPFLIRKTESRDLRKWTGIISWDLRLPVLVVIASRWEVSLFPANWPCSGCRLPSPKSFGRRMGLSSSSAAARPWQTRGFLLEFWYCFDNVQ